MPQKDVRLLLLALGAWWVLWSALQGFILYWNGFSALISASDALVTISLLGASGFSIFNLFRFYNPRRSNRVMLVVAPILLALLCALVQQSLLTWLFQYDSTYVLFLKDTRALRALYDLLMVGLVVTLSLFWSSLKDQTQIESRLRETERLARESELSGLRLQLNPHFLFNSLNSANALIGSKPEEARNMIQQLSDFLRGTIRVNTNQLNSLQDELRRLSLYLEIEKVRFGHRLQVQISLQPGAEEALVPALILQPLVENAIKFGLYETTGAIAISIVATMDQQGLSIVVENPFDPHLTAVKKGEGFGLSSIKRRLELLYHRNDLLKTLRRDNIFVCQLTIPLS